MATTKPAEAKAPHLFLSHVALSELELGDKLKGASVNARQEYDPADVKALAKSIGEVGLLVPLTVTRPARDKGPWYVIDGNTRLMALRTMHKQPDWPGVLVPTFEPADGADAVQGLELSMIANSERKDLHPVDRFEVFAKMVANGATVEQIAARYMLKVPQVRQALSLARMAPEIRQAWREGAIGGEAAEAYAQTPDHEHQRRTLKKLKGRTDAWAIKREIAGDENVGALLKFVGRDAYEKAGHHINTSLFADEDDRHSETASNVPALRALAGNKLEDERTRLLKDGWGWVLPADDAPNDRHSWRRLGPSPTKENKAQAGCTVGIDNNGTLKVERGYVKPGASVVIPKSPAEKKAAQAKAKLKKATGGLSQALCFRLSTSITEAAIEALRTDPKLALRVAVAGMACAGSPVRIDLHGHDEKTMSSRHDNDFEVYFDALKNRSTDDLLKTLATWTAASLQLVAHSPDSMPMRRDDDSGFATFLEAIPPNALNKALRERFDRKDYFASVSGDLIRSALIDCGGLELAAGCSTMKKPGKIAYAIDKVSPLWLPPEMRTAHYDGPAATPAGPKAAKATKAARKHK